ncbi:TRAP transporter large permease [Fodinicurvata halophila]|uniref:TRAP transporter large permease protein n=1 Tax=Fodinicurvata halophila TaxID=1419723 RepID=A0ABV8UMF3_9PROT
MLLYTLILLVVLLALAIPVAATLVVMGFALNWQFSMMPLHKVIAEITWTSSTSFILVAIPLFILLGEILLRAGIAERMYGAMRIWLTWLPGGLMHSNIVASAAFAATSGSSIATAATIGTVAEPQIRKQGCNERLFLGTLAAGGTVGILIPPSINMIIYGVLTNTSIAQLYIAGIIPGILLAMMFMLTIFIACALKPSWGGRQEEATWTQRFSVIADFLPPFAIFFAIMGSIYLGWATPTESAAIGVIVALFLALCHGRLNLRMLRSAFEGAMRTTAMVMLVIMAAYFLNFVLSGIGLTSQLNEFIVSLDLTKYQLLITIILFYVVLGFFMEVLTLMITTVPIIAPIVFSAGFDPIWFGVILMILLETALVTPPIGLNLYVVQGIRKAGPIHDVIIGVVPFVFAMFAMIAILIGFPELATYLPGIMK